jgi:hypothetical protein
VLTVHFLAEPFTPGPPYSRDPQPDPTPVDPEILADLTAAFNSAPPSFKDQLCRLNAVFITRHGCTGYDPGTCNLADNEAADNSWGFREPDGDRYIGISLALWRNNACPGGRRICAPPFQTYQTRLTRASLIAAGLQGPKPLSARFADRLSRYAPSYAVSPDTTELSVLASLAHEFGHILWWDTFVQPPGSPTVSNTAEFCGGGFYPYGRWQGAVVDVPPGRWVRFGEILSSRSHSPTSSLPRLLSSQDFAAVDKRLNEIYANGEWPSALSAFSSDEYFVETFELSVLLKAGLQNLNVDLTSGGAPHRHYIVRNANVSPALRRKLECFGPLTR